MKWTELQNSSRRADIAVPSSMKKVPRLSLGHISAPVISDVSSNIHRVQGLDETRLPCGVVDQRDLGIRDLALLAWERGTEIINLRISLFTAKDEFNILQDQISHLPKRWKKGSLSSETRALWRWVASGRHRIVAGYV